ncbi:serine protease inhibitor ecotin [Shewanella pneumatophori]|uniref:Serine protease inhibitor ecotin n=2 Tax=Shewanella pneumatophori TaxID=314092 RepID=A0A9X1Z924_9GAMM|nr:serine protease inhibitor ecotin [Shewanella pneumatophori]MCL1137168.1 serine protease inhibitor ecotin [Shewanella pneumatophori]
MTRTLLTTSLTIGAITLAAMTFSASATSPVHPSAIDQPMLTSQSYTSKSYKVSADTKMYPKPEAGQVQHILTLPKLDNENDYMVEIEIGQSRMVDCNKHSLNGDLQQLTVKGWGYNYYQVDNITDGPSTMMACFEQVKTEQFLTIRSDLMMKYDSRTAKVFYLPENTQIRYRVWQATSEFDYSK